MKRKRAAILCAAAALVLCAALWYTRPVSLSSFVASPQTMQILLRYEDAEESQYRSLRLERGSGDGLMERAADLPFRRSLLNPLRSLINGVRRGNSIPPQEISCFITLSGDDRSASLRFYAGSWSYSDQFLPCALTDENAGAELVELLWETAIPAS